MSNVQELMAELLKRHGGEPPPGDFPGDPYCQECYARVWNRAMTDSTLRSFQSCLYFMTDEQKAYYFAGFLYAHLAAFDDELRLRQLDELMISTREFWLVMYGLTHAHLNLGRIRAEDLRLFGRCLACVARRMAELGTWSCDDWVLIERIGERWQRRKRVVYLRRRSGVSLEHERG